MTKRCITCGEEKPLAEFYRAAGTRDGHRGDCKVCNLAAKAERYRRDPTKAIARTKAWQEANPDRHRAYQRERRQRPDGKARERESYLKRKYGITLEQYDAMLEAQGGVCAICGRPPREDISLHVDHDHVTGALRGLLCFLCNNSVGDLAEDPARARTLAIYLDDHDPEMVEMRRW